MRYVTATIGAIFIFVGMVVICIVVSSFLPPALQAPLAIDVGPVWLRGSPGLLVGMALGLLAAIHSFRSTLKRDQVARNVEPGEPGATD